MPLKSTKASAPIQNRFLGVSTPEDIKVAEYYRKNADPVYTEWAVNEVVNWKNDWLHPNISHIHGDNDKMFPIKTIAPNYIVKGGGHFMIMNRATEVSGFVNSILNQ